MLGETAPVCSLSQRVAWEAMEFWKSLMIYYTSLVRHFPAYHGGRGMTNLGQLFAINSSRKYIDFVATTLEDDPGSSKTVLILVYWGHTSKVFDRYQAT